MWRAWWLIGLLLAAVPVRAQEQSQAADARDQLQQQLATLQNTLAQKRWFDAAQAFDGAWGVLQSSEDLIPGVRLAEQPLQDGENLSAAGARARLRKLFREAPPEFRQEYQRQYGATAEQQLLSTMQSGRSRVLQKQIRRHEQTSAAQLATLHLVMQTAVRGEFLEAALLLQRADRHISQSSGLQLLLAELWWRAGFPEEAETVMRRLTEQHGYESELVHRTGPVTLPTSVMAIPGWLRSRWSGNRDIVDPGWPMPLGNSAHNRAQPHQSANLQRQWQYSLFQSPDHPEFESLLTQLANETREMLNQVPLPSAQPLVTSDLVIFAGVGSLQAVNRNTGKLIWESSRFDRQLKTALQQVQSDDQFGRGSLLARSLLHSSSRQHGRGQLVSSGRWLFAVEESGRGLVSGRAWVGGIEPDRNVNVLRAYDRKSGRLMAQAGGNGKRGDIRSSAALHGMFFLGAPLILKDRILILAEDEHGIQLLDLRLVPESPDHPERGWKFVIEDRQRLITPRFQLPEHPVRRFCGVTPAFGQGRIFCHASAGHVFALSAADLSVEWVHCYHSTAREPEITGQLPVLAGTQTPHESSRYDLHRRPHDSLIRISEDRLLLMPRDSDQVICMDTRDGRQIWTRPRGDFRFVAQLTKAMVVLAGWSEVVSLGLADGQIQWQQELSQLRISGQPAWTPDLIYAPTEQGTILVIDAATGRRRLNQKVSSQPVGNLLSVPGQLLSLGSHSIQCWRTEHLGNPPEVVRLRNQLLTEDPQEVLADLVTLLENSAADDPQHRDIRALLTSQLLEGLRYDYEAHRKHVPRLRQLLETQSLAPERLAVMLQNSLGMTLYDAMAIPQRWAHLDRLQQQRQQLDESVLRSLDGWPDLPPEELKNRLTEVVQSALNRLEKPQKNGQVHVLTGARAAGAIHRTLTSLSAPERILLAQKLKPVVAAAVQNSDEDLLLNQVVFCWSAGLAESLPDTDNMLLPRLPSKIRPALQTGLLSSRLAGWQNPAAARSRLREHWQQADGVAFKNWPATTAEPTGPGNDAAGSLADQLRRARRRPSDELPDAQIRIGDARGPMPIGDHARGAPYRLLPLYGMPGMFRGWQFVLLNEPQATILAIDHQGRQRWKLRPEIAGGLQIRPSRQRRQQGEPAYAVACGRLLAFSLNDVLYLADGVAAAGSTPRILWHQPLEQVLPPATVRQRHRRMWQRTTMYDRRPDALAPLGPLTEFGLPVFRGDRLVVFCPWTGTIQWMQDELREDTRLAAAEDSLCLISESAGQIQRRDMRDGSLLNSGPLPDWWAEGNESYDVSVRQVDLDEDPGVWRVDVEGTRCLLFEAARGGARLVCYDLARLSANGPALAWDQRLPADTVVSNVENGLVATLSDERLLQIRQVSDGRVTAKQNIPAAPNCHHLYLRTSQDRHLLLTYTPRSQQEQWEVNGAVPVNGPIVALDTRDGSLIWEAAAQGEYLRILNAEQFPTVSTAPLLILLERRFSKGTNALSSRYASRIFATATGQQLFADDNLGRSLSRHLLRVDENGVYTVSFDRRDVWFRFDGRPFDDPGTVAPNTPEERAPEALPDVPPDPES